jgi:sn-glycerol 3-phosphate transport system permease protein
MQSDFSQRLNQVLQFVLMAVLAGFMAWFIVSETSGWQALGQWLLDALRRTPDFFTTMADYYTSLPLRQIAPSLLIGVLLGGLFTGARNVSRRTALHFPALTWPWLGLVVTALTLFAGGRLLLAVGLGVGVVIALSLFADQAFRAFDWTLVTQKTNRTAFGRGALIGGAVGGFSSQIFAYPMQHCTFAPDASALVYDLGLVIALVSAVILLVPTWTVLFRRRVLRGHGSEGHFGGRGLPYLLLLPTLLVLVVFLYFPGVQMLLLSLNRRRFPLPQEEFVCLENYIALKDDVVYRNSMLTTAFITIVLVIMTMTLALMIALLASQKVKGASVYRTLLIWPFALSPVITGYIFLTMFREGGAGIINYFLDDLFGITARWLRDPSLAPWVIILASVWNALGFNILFYIAGLQNVPSDLQDAAAIDGANAVQRFFRITLPLLSPFTFFLLVTNVTYAFYGIYGVVDSITRGGPPLGPGGTEGGATNILIYKLYEDAFRSGAPIGSAAGQAMILFLLVAAITLLQFRFVENRVTYVS